MTIKQIYFFVSFVVGLLLIFLGLRYNIYYVRDHFSYTGRLPAKFEAAVVIVNVACVAAGILLVLGRKRLEPHAREFLLVVGSVLVSLIFLEAGFRAYLYAFAEDLQPQYLSASEVTLARRFVRHHYLGYVPAPGYVSLDGLNRHNALGFRGDEISRVKLAGTYRIVFVGGSSTYTERVPSYKEAWPYLTGKELRRICGYDDIEVINGGVGGYDSFQSLMNIQYRILDLAPDLIIVHHGVNDAHARLVRPSRYRADNSGRRRPWSTEGEPWFMYSVLIRMSMTALTGQPFEPAVGYYYNSPYSAAGVRDEGIDERLGDTPMNALALNPPIYFERNLRSMAAVARANGADILFITWPYSTAHDDYMRSRHYQTAIAEINATAARVGADTGTFVYALEKDMPRDAEYWWDNRHVNREGARLKARLTAKGISDYVCPRARRGVE